MSVTADTVADSDTGLVHGWSASGGAWDTLLCDEIGFAEDHLFDLLAAMGAQLPVGCGSVDDHERQLGWGD
jgi:hypothetical protein